MCRGKGVCHLLAGANPERNVHQQLALARHPERERGGGHQLVVRGPEGLR